MFYLKIDLIAFSRLYDCNTDYSKIIFGRTNNSVITYYFLCLGFVTNMFVELKSINKMA